LAYLYLSEEWDNEGRRTERGLAHTVTVTRIATGGLFGWFLKGTHERYTGPVVAVPRPQSLAAGVLDPTIGPRVLSAKLLHRLMIAAPARFPGEGL
jgi:hypothetical protein